MTRPCEPYRVLDGDPDYKPGTYMVSDVVAKSWRLRSPSTRRLLAPCEVCFAATTPCPHGFNLCPDDRHECQPCADEAEAEHYDALIGEQQADDWAIDARREGL